MENETEEETPEESEEEAKETEEESPCTCESKEQKDDLDIGEVLQSDDLKPIDA